MVLVMMVVMEVQILVMIDVINGGDGDGGNEA